MLRVLIKGVKVQDSTEEIGEATEVLPAVWSAVIAAGFVATILLPLWLLVKVWKVLKRVPTLLRLKTAT